MKHFTKDKGDLAVAKVAADLHEKGFTVWTPTFSEHCPYDLIVADEKQNLQKVQVKFRSMDKNKRISIAMVNTASNSNGFYRKDVDISEFDLYAIYCDATNECYYIDNNYLKGKVTFTLSTVKPKKMGTSRLAEDFTDYPTFVIKH